MTALDSNHAEDHPLSKEEVSPTHDTATRGSYSQSSYKSAAPQEPSQIASTSYIHPAPSVSTDKSLVDSAQIVSEITWDDVSLSTHSYGESIGSSLVQSHASRPRKSIPRKGHTKSRRGCYNCKRRRIKCNERHPECNHCIKAGLQCGYPANIIRSTKESLNTVAQSSRSQHALSLAEPIDVRGPIPKSGSQHTRSEPISRAQTAIFNGDGPEQNSTGQDVNLVGCLGSRQDGEHMSSPKDGATAEFAPNRRTAEGDSDASRGLTTGSLGQELELKDPEYKDLVLSAPYFDQSDLPASVIGTEAIRHGSEGAKSPIVRSHCSTYGSYSALNASQPGLERLYDWMGTFGVRGRGNSSQSTRTSHPTPNEYADASSSATLGLNQLKRSLKSSSNDNDGRKRHKRRARVMVEHGDVAAEKYACPFPKNNPRQHTRCWNFAFDKERFPDLKQHFDRCHTIPVHCSRCGIEFHGDQRHAQRDVHLRQQPQCEQSDLSGRWSGITADQLDLIKRNKSRKMLEHDYWMYIYEILFNSQPLSGHPFHEDYKALEARIMVKSITDAVINNIVSFFSYQEMRLSPPCTDQTFLTQGLRDLIEAGVNTAFATADMQKAHTPSDWSLPSPTVTSTTLDLCSLTEATPIHVALSSEEVCPEQPKPELFRDRDANDNGHDTTDTDIPPIMKGYRTSGETQDDEQGTTDFGNPFMMTLDPRDSPFLDEYGLFNIVDDLYPSSG